MTVSLPELGLSIESLRRSLASTKTTLLLPPSCPEDALQEVLEPFVKTAQPQIDKLDRLNTDLQKELQSLLVFFGEKDGSIESLFSTVLTFAHGLQKAAAEMTRHALLDEEAKKQQAKAAEGVSKGTIDAMSKKLDSHEAMLSAVTIKRPKYPIHTNPGPGSSGADGQGSYFPYPAPPIPESTPSSLALRGASDGTLARRSVRGTLSRGELDEAIRSIHGGVKRRERDTLGKGGVRLSKMFLDGGQRGMGSVGSAAAKIEGTGGGVRPKDVPFPR